MLEPISPRNAIIAAAMRLAGQRPWRKVALADVASGAGVTLLALKNEFSDKTSILSAFMAAVDDELLARTKATASEQGRDALFEVIMSRFDVLAPYKPALRSIAGDIGLEPALIRPMLISQQWMLEAARIATGGVEGAAKVLGLASVYASVFRIWLDDDDAGMARTMAALDRRLRRGERTLQRVDDVCAAINRVGAAFRPRSSASSTRSDAGPAPAADAPGGGASTAPPA